MKNSAIAMASLLLIFIVNATKPIYAEQFFCQSGDVTCLIAAINTANGTPSQNTIKLAPGIYTLQAAVESDTGLPIIKGSIKITATSDTDPTVIEAGPTNHPPNVFRIFQVAPNGELILEGITAQRGISPPFGEGGAIILNFGSTTLRDSIVTLAVAGLVGEAIKNLGTLNVVRSIIADNNVGFGTGAITNGDFSQQGGTVLIENSTIAHNHGDGTGGILNIGGVVVVTNSAIVDNSGFPHEGGIVNVGGSVTITSSTIAKNFASQGGGIFNLNGLVSITNSTIRENETAGALGAGGGGIFNQGGSVQIQNTILAGNTVSESGGPFQGGPDCLGTITSLGNNLIGDVTDCDITLQLSDIVGDPGLGPLVGTGEDEEPGEVYYPVLAGSPVINAGNKKACPNKDQLGNNTRGKCDIGAVEFEP